MSKNPVQPRTRTHRPYWVQSAEHGANQDHRHELFGQPVTVSRRMRDARGRILTTEVPVRINIERAASLAVPPGADNQTRARYERVRDEARRLRSAGAPAWKYVDGPDLRTVSRTQTVVIGHYADRCTIDEPIARDGRLRGRDDLYAPCTRSLDGQQAARSFGRGSERDDGVYRDWRVPSRRSVRVGTRKLSRRADADGRCA